MRIFTLIFFVSLLNAQITVQDPGTGSTITSLTITPISSDLTGTRVRIQGTFNGEYISELTTLNSAVNEVPTTRGNKLAILLQRPYPTPILPATLGNTMQFASQAAAAALDRIQIKRYINQQIDSKEAQRLGFSSISKMKGFMAKNRSKIAQARKNGSTDPAGEVLALLNEKADYKLSAEKQSYDVAEKYNNLYMNLQPIFQKAQYPIYTATAKLCPPPPPPTEQDLVTFADVSYQVEELRINFITEKRKILSTGDMTIDARNQNTFDTGVERLRSLTIKTEPPFTRENINDAQQVVNQLKVLMALPLSN
jgi:hypothetical protein